MSSDLLKILSMKNNKQKKNTIDLAEELLEIDDCWVNCDL